MAEQLSRKLSHWLLFLRREGSIDSTHMVVYCCRPVTPLRGESNALFWLLGVWHTGCAQTYMQAKHLYT